MPRPIICLPRSSSRDSDRNRTLILYHTSEPSETFRTQQLFTEPTYLSSSSTTIITILSPTLQTISFSIKSPSLFYLSHTSLPNIMGSRERLAAPKKQNGDERKDVDITPVFGKANDPRPHLSKTIFTFNRFTGKSYAYGRNGSSTDLRRISTTFEKIDTKLNDESDERL